MNYPMKDGQIDPEFVEKIKAVKGSYARHEIKEILLAAQEVMQEMEFEKGNPQGLKRGDLVLHGVWPGLAGEGEVLELKPPVFELRTIVPAKAVVRWASGRIGEENPNYINRIEKEEAQHGEG